ncbi:peptidoglycan DD-metalloendopeptidase family protein [Hydrogenobacter sp. T-2]|uniref:peptidoglycan DD-metalloendopeptidase family protein n=1 Tax=Pampinifervens diazotrophicum TaxID=1632018 RepID=UPI002B25EF48|nr:peptidoglycan DD-metalloendopeptidase family protein [Hydrogenobacter sp. T-2]WPM32240.1 peptidoglycan DD-metalloendopeptidase family protein [Hydrogenobacter sp. T-2]
MKDRITITILWHDHRKPLSLSVRKSFLRNLAILLSLVLLLLISLKAWALWNYVEKWRLLAKKEQLIQRVADLEEEWKRLDEERRKIEEKKHRLSHLEKKLLDIQKYLSERGVKINLRGAVGGGRAFEPAHLDYLEALNLFAEETYKSLKGLPIGYPVSGNITSTYGLRKNPFGRGYEFHTGIDIEAPQGTPVRATADGVVVLADRFGNYGKTVIIRHPTGYSTLYAHLSRIEVHNGQRIRAGQTIGRVGSTGRSTGPHLHYEVILDNKALDPMKFLVWR